jgi:hypothetical protein
VRARVCVGKKDRREAGSGVEFGGEPSRVRGGIAMNGGWGCGAPSWAEWARLTVWAEPTKRAKPEDVRSGREICLDVDNPLKKQMSGCR